MRILIGHQGAVCTSAPIDARRKPSLPKHFIAAQKYEIDASIGCRLDVCTLAIRPVFIMARIHVDFVIEQQ